MRLLKTALMLLTALFLANCSKEELNEKQLTNNNSNTTASGGDGVYDLLGYGIDITKNMSDLTSPSDVSIFDLSHFTINREKWIDINTTTTGSESYISGVNALEYSTAYSNKKSFDGSAKVEVNVSKLNFTLGLKLNKNREDSNAHTYSDRYSYASFEARHQVKRIRFTQDVSMERLIESLTPEFLNYIQTHSAQEIVNRYGTHVLLDIGLGGIIKLDYSGDVTSIQTEAEKKEHLKTGFSFGVLKLLNLDIEKNKTTTQKQTAHQEIRRKTQNGIYYGGTNSGRSFTFNSDGLSSETISLSSWQSGINDRNAALIDIGKAIFIYHFISDPIKKQAVKTAVEQHIDANQIELTPDYTYQLMNVMSFVAHSGGHHYLSTTMVNDFSYWRYEGPIFKAYNRQIPGTVAVRAYVSHKRKNHFYTTGSLNSSNTDMGWWQWQDEGIAFYAYTTQLPGTIPIYEHYSDRGTDHFFSPDPSRTLGDPSYWTSVAGPAFYAYPASYQN
ncbi:MAG: hypothetical protein LBE37_21495 [Sphingobacterium sp.]|jgi:hypothetical protein|nr:hypothetical protein [Sphingobacterium sp.]